MKKTNTFPIGLVLFVLIGLFSISLQSCKQKLGCTDPNAANYDPDATRYEYGSCQYGPGSTTSIDGTYNGSVSYNGCGTGNNNNSYIYIQKVGNEIALNNLLGLSNVKMVPSTSTPNTFTFPAQYYFYSNFNTVDIYSGTATLSGTQLDIELVLSDVYHNYSCGYIYIYATVHKQ